MALTRVTGKVFGSNAPLDEIGIFGSAKSGTPTNSTDITEIQSLPAYLLGWGSGVVSNNNFPPMEEVTGVLKTISYQTCYLLQEGIPTYDANTNYSNTSIVKTTSGNQLILYISKINNNQGNPLNDTNSWSQVVFAGTSAIGAPQFTMNMNATLPENCIWLEGSEVSKSNYRTLYSIYGDNYGTPTNPAYFVLPDFRNRYLCGVGSDLSQGYITAGLPTLTVSSVGNHTHGVGTYQITGEANHIGRTSVSGVSRSGCLLDRVTKVSSSGFYGNTDSYAHSINVLANASNGFGGFSGAAGEHTHTITSSVPTNLDTMKVDGVKVRVYTRYQ